MRARYKVTYLVEVEIPDDTVDFEQALLDLDENTMIEEQLLSSPVAAILTDLNGEELAGWSN